MEKGIKFLLAGFGVSLLATIGSLIAWGIGASAILFGGITVLTGLYGFSGLVDYVKEKKLKTKEIKTEIKELSEEEKAELKSNVVEDKKTSSLKNVDEETDKNDLNL